MLISLTIALSVCLITRGDKDNIVVKNLRKQLMKENYDYSLESNETHTVLMRADINLEKNNSKDESTKSDYFKNTSEKNEVSSQSENTISKFHHFSTSNVIDDSQMSYEKDVNKIYKKPLEQPISVKDLLYYMDDEKLLKHKLGPETRDMMRNARKNMGYKATDKKYKLLKIRHQFRRDSPRRFIQEENNEGVVIINLDNATLPEFRLPRSRRQYMHDHGEVVAEEEEVPPPPVVGYLVAGGDVNPLAKVLSKV